MKKIALILLLLLSQLSAFAAGNMFKDIRQIYLWDVTLSMKGYGGNPDIYDKVLSVMIKDIESIDNDRTEIVVIAFQDTEYCQIWRTLASENEKQQLIEDLKNYNNDEVTNTCLSAPLKYVMNSVLSGDKIDILKIMTDGNDNVNFPEFGRCLDKWCDISNTKDAYGYYILLTKNAKDEKTIVRMKNICNFEVIDAEHDLDGINKIRQLNLESGETGIPVNIRDEYNKPKRVKFIVYGGDGRVKPGFKIKFQTEENPYIDIDEECELAEDNTVILHPKFKMSQEDLKASLTAAFENVNLYLDPSEEMQDGDHSFVRIVNKMTKVTLINKPEKTVKIYVE